MVAFTEEQQRAIEYRGGTLLVSAAAGSGKTAVLVERIIQKLLDTEHRSSILDFLIVTFTKAAAAEMREKITDALYKRLQENPRNVHLQRELSMMGEAKIDTIDGFYYKTVRNHAEHLGLSPRVRIGNESELLLLQERVLEQVLDTYYKEGSPAFLQAIDFFSRARDDMGFIQVVKSVLAALETYPEPRRFLEMQMKMYRGDITFDDLPFVAETRCDAHGRVEFGLACLEKAILEAGEDDVLAKAYVPALQEYRRFLQALQLCIGADWNSAYTMLRCIPSPRLGAARGVDKSFAEEIKALRDQAKEICADLGEKYFFLTKEEVLQDMEDMAPHMEVLIQFVQTYEEALLQEKKQRGCFGFSDLSRFMYNLLIANLGEGVYEKTSIAESLAAEFQEIFVDEYQDTNGLQDLIFKAISKDETNLFMVGDAKQSIYRFRQAEPEIFMEKKDRYGEWTPLAKEEHKKGVQLALTKNFRSRRSIIDFVNFVFGMTFGRETAEMEYTDKEALDFGATYYDMERDTPVEVHLLAEAGEEGAEESFGDEADFVVEKVQEILASKEVLDKESKQYRKAEPRDIVILLRSLKGAAGSLQQKLGEQQIGVFCDVSEAFFQREEISLLLSLLKVIDNPLQDIPLAAVMLSFLFEFTPEEMAEISLQKGGSFYEKLQTYAKVNGKCKSFTDKISWYRAKSRQLSVEELLLFVMGDLDYNGRLLQMSMGDVRVLHVRLLLEYAAEFEESAFRGLFSFNAYIRKTIESGRDMPGARTASENSNVVRIMTIHKSKGLEFPFVILCDMARRFNTKKYSEAVQIHKALGIGSKLRDTDRMTEYHTAQRSAIVRRMEREAVAEELRCLYVALTRAKEGLFLFINSKGKQNTVRKMQSALAKDGRPHPVQILAAASPAKILLYSTQFAKAGEPLNGWYDVKQAVAYPTGFQAFVRHNISPSVLAEEEAQSVPLEREAQPLEMDFCYPFLAATEAPTKTSVTALKKEGAKEKVREPVFDRPGFLTEKGALTGAERGTAMHRAVECADFAALERNVEGEIARLVQRGFLSEAQGKACSVAKLRAFTASHLFRRMERSLHLEKELVFNCFIERADGRQLLQGIMDVVFTEAQGTVIVDFKTDQVKSEEELVEKYALQLQIYREAYEKMSGTSVAECVIYSFALDKEIKIWKN